MLLDYELIGNLQVSDGIVSGFNNSTSNYIKIPFSLPMGSNKVEIYFSLYYPDLSSASVMLANYNDAASGGGLVLRTDGNYSTLKYWAWNSSGSMIAEGINLGFSLTVGTNIIKLVYENSTITWYKSINGKDFTQGTSRSGTIADFKNYVVIGASGTAWKSGNMQVNMLDSYIKVNDEYWHSKEYSKQKTKIIQRHDRAANWTSVNPVLAVGEIGVETDTNKFKFGDGTTAWSGLAYAAGEGGGGDSYTKAETDSLLSTKQDKLTALKPITIKTDGTLVADLEVSGTIVNNGDGSYTNPISTAGRTNWVKVTPALDCIYTSDWEIIIPFKWDRNSNEDSQTFIGGNANTFIINIEDNNFRVWYNSSGYATTKFLPSIGVKTWMRLKYSGGVLQISFSTNGETYSNLTSNSRSVLSNRTETYFFGGEQSWQQNKRGGMFTIFFNEVKVYKGGVLQYDGLPAYSDPFQAISANPATTTSLGVVQPDGTSITVSDTGVISAVGGVQSQTIHSMVVMTQAEYDALTTKDDTVLYLIREETV